MADLPRRRLPASAFTPFTAAGDPEPVWSKERGVGSGSEMVSGGESDDPDNFTSGEDGSHEDQGDTSCEDADSVDTEEELRRDLEEQRIADEKNGHFVEARLPTEGGMLTEGGSLNPEVAAHHVARVFYEVAASSTWGRSSSTAEKKSSSSSTTELKNSSFTGDLHPPNPEMPAIPSTASYTMQHGFSADDGMDVEKVTMMGFGEILGGSMHESTMEDVHDVDGSMVADCVMPISIMKDSAFNACDDSSPTCLTPLTRQPILMKDANLCAGNNGKLKSKDVDMVDCLDAPGGPRLLSNGEQNLQLDLAEGRPLAVQQVAADHTSELHLMGSTHDSPNQVFSSTGSALISHPIKYSQPNTPAQSLSAQHTQHKYASTNSHKPNSPPSSTIKPLAHAKNKSQSLSNPILPTAAAHPKIKPQTKPSSHSAQIAASLFSGPTKNDPQKFTSANLLLHGAAPDLVTDFPPLVLSTPNPNTLGSHNTREMQDHAPTPSHTPQPEPPKKKNFMGRFNGRGAGA